MNIFLSTVFIVCCGLLNAAADHVDLDQPVIVEMAQSDRIIHTLREFFGADHVELCSLAEIQQHAPCAAVFFRDLEHRQFWSLVDIDRLQGEFQTAYNNLITMQPQNYQSLFNYPHFRVLLQQLRTIGGISGVEIFAGKMALRGQSFLVSEEALSLSDIYELGEDLERMSVEKSALYFRIGLIVFIGIMIYIGLHSHGVI